MKKNNKKVKKQIIIICALVVLIVGCVIACIFIIKNNNTTVSEPPVVVEPVEEKKEEIEEVEENPYQDRWEANKAKNDDYVGEIIFDSGIVDMPFVCPSKDYHEYQFFIYPGNVVTDYENGCESGTCSGNDVYLRTDWETMEYHPGGSLFMDYRNMINDQNIIIYGHNYITSLDPNRELFFTPLEFLMKEENYEANKYLNIVLNNEVRRYEVAYVYIYHIDSDYDTLQYFRTTYDEDYFGEPDPGYYQSYIDKMESVKLYDTGVKLTTSDKTLTLQTCVENRPNEIELVVCKQIDNN